MASTTTGETVVVLGAVVFLAAQLLNRVALRWRALGSLAGIAVSVIALLVEPTAWEAAVFGWFLAVAALLGKWGREVGFDLDARRDKGRQPLARDFLGINVYLNPFFIALYRHRMFRDPWSRKRVMRDSFSVPTMFEERLPPQALR